MKFRIFFDSNQIFNKNGPLNEPFDTSIGELNTFLTKHEQLENVIICLPEVVIEERIQHKLEQIKFNIEGANERIGALKQVGYTTQPISDLGVEKHKEILAERANALIKKFKVQKVLNGKVDVKNLVEKSIAKIKPFNDKGVGLKDTLIFLSMIEDAQAQPEPTTYLFCTNNKTQFDEDVVAQFKEVTGKVMYILENPAAVQVKLDELIPLNLHLEERNKKIESFILKRIGTLNKIVNERADYLGRSFVVGGYGGSHGPASTYGVMNYRPVSGYVAARYADDNYNGIGSSGQSDAVDEMPYGFDFNDIHFTHFEELTENVYKISAKYFTNIVYGKKERARPTNHGWGGLIMEDDYVYRPSALNVDTTFAPTDYDGFAYVDKFSNRPLNKLFDLEILCNFNNDSIDISSIF